MLPFPSGTAGRPTRGHPPGTQPEPVSANIYVPYVAGSEGGFIRGVDVSSLLSILQSGAHYYDADGNMLGDSNNTDSQGKAFMRLLSESGVNWVRLRIWPDPYDSNHNGYGGGNNDLEAAKAMGKWATDAGMKVLIDFHYSDFWCDPAKQKSPKAWAGLPLDERADAVRQYTMDSLSALIGAGVDVRMVQVGNETNNGICGVTHNADNWTSTSKIFAAGCDAVHSVTNPKLGEGERILAAVHFANPEKSGTFAAYAKQLDDHHVDYDVFASSYYPYWHGSIENLQNVLSNIARTYDKKVMVAETSWAWSLEDGDGHDNTVRTGSNDENPAYIFSVQGQATEVASVMKGIADIDVKLTDGSPAGIGVFYWEPAWIPVNDISMLTGTARETTIAANRVLWDRYGSGWAASFSKEYDPEDAGQWYGGSAVDNQAVFDFGGLFRRQRLGLVPQRGRLCQRQGDDGRKRRPFLPG